MVSTRMNLALGLLISLMVLAEAQVKDAAAPQLLVTPKIMTGFLFGLVWLTIFFSGFCCLFSTIDPPAAFEDKGLILNKEY